MTSKEFVYITYYFYLSAYILPISIGLFTWKQQPKAIRYIIINMIILGLILLFSSLAPKFGIKNNLFLNYISSVVDYTFIGLAYALAFRELKIKKTIYASIVLIAIITILDAYLITGHKNFSVFSNNLKIIFRMLLVIYYLVRLIRSEISQKLSNIPLFLLACIYLSSSSIAIITDSLQKYFMTNRLINDLYALMAFSFLLDGIFILLMAIPIWKAPHSPYNRLQV